MLFNSFHFLFFFLAFLPIYFLLRGTPRKIFTLAASYYFYMCWNARYVSIIWAITIIDYLAALLIAKAQAQSTKRLYLILSLASNIGLLLVFKYFNFLSSSVTEALNFAGLHDSPVLLNVILPIGLSFHTFQAMSYTIDVYKGKAPAERSLLNYALYVAFFPQMVAGPIERPNHLLPQFHRTHSFNWDDFRAGARRALWGLFKKMVIADGLASFVNAVYAHPERFPGIALLLATCFFSIQIYCDFSGYSDMAVGIARMMGFELTVNFRRPYFAQSIGEFWHRWHISLSTWFRDYVYIPLGGNRVSLPRFYFNILVTFLLSGIWHGANMTFVVWGAFHGLWLILSHATASTRASLTTALGLERFPRSLALLRVALTGSFVTLAWIFFRASSLTQAFYVITHLLPLNHLDSVVFVKSGIQRADLPFLLFFVCAMFAVEWMIEHPQRRPAVWSNLGFRVAMYYACTFAIIFYGVFGHVDFIYFQF
jgi:D-alanyl-lipoteichoic acid acyltransferase DltB (MBOAT superfamily)